MGYIDKNLLSDERILFRTKKHLIIFFYPIVWTILSSYAYVYMRENALLSQVAFAPWLVAAILWLYSWLEYVTSDFAVTNKRVMMREGFFTRHSNELRLAAISQVNINQSLIGQIMGYGDVAINAFGAFDTFTYISKPNDFQRHVNQQLDNVTR